MADPNQNPNLVSPQDLRQKAPRTIPQVLITDLSTRNTRNTQGLYSSSNITEVTYFSEFTYQRVRSRFGTLLENTRILNVSFTSRPIEGVTTETTNAARITEHFKPQHLRRRPNRLPGDVKPSYKWNLNMIDDRDEHVQKEFKQILSQVNYYMKQHHTRYGFVITDQELVAIKRLNRDGELQVSDSIPWTDRGTPDQPCMTVLLALWYLGMLAADERGWRLN
ncbi:hypothetical protein BO86DRAFT_415533 [Aspergillus japonicus CBS 114.51]|uniref:Uncharacterized protein n=1 Tax=Aspergillus japonicus CBS 114.51 TaxID=1448312 RepID=A0A8T8XCN3_ASPJA|nr:hypothetical protein BO86DRAFT_415533 [Aspergillus japonicus CBS 114.51]RAH86023.1 hypothetical protein BO86DRAFT_415533 [Aspergillus japonicus CBS 114.51]